MIGQREIISNNKKFPKSIPRNFPAEFHAEVIKRLLIRICGSILNFEEQKSLKLRRIPIVIRTFLFQPNTHWI